MDKRVMESAGKYLSALDGVIESLGEISVNKGTSEVDGSCNFCSSKEGKVAIIQGSGASMRACRSCLKVVQDFRF